MLLSAGCSLAHWEQARGAEAEAAERDALLAVLGREQQTCEVGRPGLLCPGWLAGCAVASLPKGGHPNYCGAAGASGDGAGG